MYSRAVERFAKQAIAIILTLVLALPPTTFATPLVPNAGFASSILGLLFQQSHLPPRRPDRNPPPVAPPARPKPAKVTPRPHTNAEWQNTLNQRQARVVRLKTTRSQDITLVSGQRLILPVIPVDAQDNPLDGIQPVFTTSDNKVALVFNGALSAGNPGRAEITARVGAHTLQFHVTVLKAERTPPRTQGTPNNKVGWNRGAAQPLPQGKSQAGPRIVKAAWRPNENSASLKTPIAGRRAASASVLLNNPPEDFATVNPYATGAPPHRTEAGANNPPAAVPGTEHPGSANFTFGIPLVNLEGRALDVALGLTYNSLVWKENGSNNFYFDDESWLAPGFGLGYGSLEHLRQRWLPSTQLPASTPSSCK
ncbi:MAG: hypothetical protein HYR56_19755 [Acidobacteria bacterium]|nr:hypothetical protein [Acidobacteriota bacterium]MBI3422052.1 hypothetical protein [Acidobacteriota bacterium]